MHNYKIIEFNTELIDEKTFDLYHDYDEVLFKELYPNDTIFPRELVKQRMSLKIPGEKIFRKVVIDKNHKSIIGSFFLLIGTKENPDYEKNKHIAEVFIVAREGYDFFKIGSMLLKEILKIIKDYKEITTIETCCFRDRVKAFWEKLNAKAAIEATQNRLYMKEVDWDMIKDWREKGHLFAKEEEIELILFQKCPEDIIDEYTSFYTEIKNLEPLGDLEFLPEDETPAKRREREKQFEDLNYEWHTLITKEKNNVISSLTEVVYNKTRKDFIHQELTGVKPEYRGRGLGKWIKAEMLFFIKNKYPDVQYLRADNAVINAPMRSINDRIGYKTYLKEKCYSVKIKNLLL